MSVCPKYHKNGVMSFVEKREREGDGERQREGEREKDGDHLSPVVCMERIPKRERLHK